MGRKLNIGQKVSSALGTSKGAPLASNQTRTRQSFFKKMFNSIIAALIGILLFLGSFVVIYFNEGKENLGAVAEEAIEITQAEHNLEKGSLICINGNLNADIYATDTYLKENNYIIINRKVEMYAYSENAKSEERDTLGGGSETTTTYTYDKRWTSTGWLEEPSKWKGPVATRPSLPTNYENWIITATNSNSLKDLESRASGLSLGRYSVTGNPVFSGQNSLALSEANVDEITGVLDYAITSDYILIANQGEISPSEPTLGDIRIMYTVVRAEDTGILFGAIDNDVISGFNTPKGNTFLRFFNETDSREEAIEILGKEYKLLLWVFRIIGFLLMYIGLILMSGPLTKFMSIVPIFSRITSFVFGVIAFFIALILTTIMILISIILHNVWLSIGAGLLIALIITLFLIRSRKNAIEA